MTDIYMDMVHKKEKLIIRITEQQARFLADVVIREQRTKSEITRQALNEFLLEKINRYENSERLQKPNK